MEFHEKRRQQFLSEKTYREALRYCKESSEYFATHPMGSGDSEMHQHVLARRTVGDDLLDSLFVQYTAGEPIDPLRIQLEQAVAAFERYGEVLWQYRNDRNEAAFDLDSIDDYCQLMQLIGLCFLLHRRDLMPRVAALQDGLDAVGERGKGNGGADWLYEEFMSFAVGPENRYEAEVLRCSKPYEGLADALSSADNEAALKDLHRYLKRWYKDLAGAGWHDSHKANEAGEQGGYYGYWAFEAGAAVLLLGIEDDSSLHQYLYYPKDLVAWARANRALSESEDGKATDRLRCEAGQPCPREGFWFTPAKADSRRRFAQGQTMPAFSTDFGATIWQWDERQQ